MNNPSKCVMVLIIITTILSSFIFLSIAQNLTPESIVTAEENSSQIKTESVCDPKTLKCIDPHLSSVTDTSDEDSIEYSIKPLICDPETGLCQDSYLSSATDTSDDKDRILCVRDPETGKLTCSDPHPSSATDTSDDQKRMICVRDPTGKLTCSNPHPDSATDASDDQKRMLCVRDPKKGITCSDPHQNLLVDEL